MSERVATTAESISVVAGSARAAAHGRALPRITGALLTLLLLLAPVACTPLYLPLVPEPLEAPQRLVVAVEEDLEGGRPSVTVRLREVPQAGWLAVQWFGPDNRERASESRWIEPGVLSRPVVFVLPGDVAVEPGRWRAILSLGDETVRQISFEVPRQER